MEIVFFVVFCLCCISYGECVKYKYETFYFRQKDDVILQNINIQENILIPPVDHFSYANNDYFMQRYLLNVDHYEPYGNGTVFVYAGNEGDIKMFAQNTGFMWEHARMFHAALLFIEHRYYGQSLPYGDLSYKNITYLGYLTSEQALADYAAIITHLESKLPEADKVPHVIFGGSYGGMLAAWMRIKYPHIVCGAVASSAPILSIGELRPCDTFPKIVTQDFLKDGGSESVKSIRKSWPIIRRIYNETGGMEHLIQNFHLCQSNSFDVDDLISWLSDTWSYMAMTDYPYSTNFLNPLPAFPIKEACKYLQNSSLPDEEIIFNIYKAASVFHNYTGQVMCFNLTEAGGKYLGTDGWEFQECTEMVQSLCQTGVTDMFEPKEWNYPAYQEKCLNKYGTRPIMYKTLWLYGGDELESSSNIVFTNGLLDPWYGGGILKSISDTVVAIVMEDAAHHLDLRSSNPSDPPSVVDARQLIIKYIWQFITEARVKQARYSVVRATHKVFLATHS